MLALLQKYQAIVSLLKVSSLTTTKLDSVLKMAGYKLDPGLLELSIDLIKGKANELREENLFKVLSHPETQTSILSLTESIALEKINDNVMAEQAQLSGPSKDVVNWDDYVHKDSMIKCAHCKGLLHIRSNIA